MSAGHLVACHECDLLHRVAPIPAGASARCSRCGAVLYRNGRDVVQRCLAFALGSLVLFGVANAFPFMSFRIGGREQVNHLATGVWALNADGFPELAFVVAVTSLAAPALLIGGLLYLLLPLQMGRRPRGAALVCRAIAHLKPWSMMEVYLLGVIVSVIKLSDMAEIVLGPACFAFMGLILVLTAAVAAFDVHVVWELLDRLEPARPGGARTATVGGGR